MGKTRKIRNKILQVFQIGGKLIFLKKKYGQESRRATEKDGQRPEEQQRKMVRDQKNDRERFDRDQKREKDNDIRRVPLFAKLIGAG